MSVEKVMVTKALMRSVRQTKSVVSVGIVFLRMNRH